MRCLAEGGPGGPTCPRDRLVVDIEQIFFHCAKAFIRSQLWEPQTWAPAALPTVAAITKAVMPGISETVEELEQYYGTSYSEQLYKH